MATNKINPPKLPAQFLEWYCGEELAEDLLGDADEIFYTNLKKMSAFRASVKYWGQILVLLFSYAVRSRKRNHFSEGDSAYSWAMFQNYSKIAFRSLGRQKTFSIINAICLSTGMSVGLLALAAFVDMNEADNFHTKKDRIYRVITNVDDGNEKITFASSSDPIAQKLLHEATGIESIVQFNKNFQPEVINGNNTTIPLAGYYASNDFFKVFSFSLLEGDASTALLKPFSLILTEASAKKLFGNENALGKTVQVKTLGEFVVTGVLKDYHRSHLLFDALASFNTISVLETQGTVSAGLNDWGPKTNFYTYILFQGDKNPSDLTYLLDQIAADQNNTAAATSKIKLELQNIEGIPGTDYYNEIGLVWGYLAMSVFFALALLVLLPACFNYTNISIARALKRAKEIGLRKVSGGQSKNIFVQMVMETIILSLISLLGAVLIFITIRTEFKSMLVEGSKTFDLEITPLTFLLFLIFAIVAGVFAGIFPASYFSKLNPIETLRNSSLSGKLSKVNVRKGLIVFQFTVSLVFILGVAIMAKQYRYALNFDYGFQKENILEIPIKNADAAILKTELSRLSEVASIAMSSAIPGSWQANSIWVQPINNEDDSLRVYQMFVDDQYLDCLELELLAGNNFSTTSSSTEEFIIVNEEFLKRFKIENNAEALDQAFIVDGNKTLRILGIVKDFNHMPLRERISAFFFRYDPNQSAFAHVKIASNDISKTLANIEDVWNKVEPNTPFESFFLDDQLEESLISFRSMMKIFGFLGLMAIVISCLGLLAVVVSTAESRLKEMGLRKVMGASFSNLAYTLSKGFIKLIVISIMIATPFTYLFFDQLVLRTHHFRTGIGLLEIGGGIVALLILVLLTIGTQTLRVANVNPVDTLKSE